MASILVVDDEMGIRELLFEILDDEGHSVYLAENAEMAHQMRRSNILDLVLLDIWMPDADGISVLRDWALDGLLDVPIIMMSGHATIDTAVEAMRIGAVDYLEKPITLKKLLSTVDKVLSAPKSQVKPFPISEKKSFPEGDNVLDFDDLMGDLDTLEPQLPSVSEQNSFFNDLSGISLDDPLRVAREHFERIYLDHLIRRTGKNMSRLAELSGLERTHLYRKLRHVGLVLPRAKKDD